MSTALDMSTTQAPLTFEDFEQLPEYAGRQELLEGELIESPPPELRHQESAEHAWCGSKGGA